MKRFLPAILTTVLCLQLLQAEDSEMRLFTGAGGRTIEAKITNVIGDEVYITREDGLATRAKISIFSQADQEFIKKWSMENLIAKGIFEITFSEKNSRKSDWTSTVVQDRTWNASYEISIKNKTSEPVKDVSIEFMEKKWEESVPGRDRDNREGRNLFQQGKNALGDFKAREEKRVETKGFPLKEYQVAAGYYYPGGKNDSKDELKGIWVKVFVAGKLAQENSRPVTMMKDEKWQESRKSR